MDLPTLFAQGRNSQLAHGHPRRVQKPVADAAEGAWIDDVGRKGRLEGLHDRLELVLGDGSIDDAAALLIGIVVAPIPAAFITFQIGPLDPSERP